MASDTWTQTCSISCNTYKLMSFKKLQQKKKAFSLRMKLKSPVAQSLSSSSLSSADLAQLVVCLGVSDDGLNGDDGLVDLGLEVPQLLDVQQSEDLSRFV